MEPINRHVGTTVALMNNDIDTDQLVPKAYLQRISKAGFGEFLMDEWRYYPGPERKKRMDFPLNHPDRQGATILISGNNFGSGSSREHAAWAIKDYGFRVVIAGSYSDIFYMNSLKNGILAIILPEEDRLELAKLPGDVEIEVFLEEQTVTANGKVYRFDIAPHWKEKLINGIDDIDETLQHQDAIRAYEEKWDDFYAY